MIEVNLYAIPKEDFNSKVGSCIARDRYDKDALGVGVEQFAKKFLKNNLEKFETSIGSPELTTLINSNSVISRSELASINYMLMLNGFKLQIQNVADDEENATGVPAGDVVEWNIINNNFIQHDYPTATKIIPGGDKDIIDILRQITDQSGFFDAENFAGMKNPFKPLFEGLDRVKRFSGSINGTLVGKIYEILDMCGMTIFCATAED